MHTKVGYKVGYKVCMLLLLLLVGAATAQAAERADTIKLRIMTYNLRLGELATLEELAAHISSFKPDVVCLQEVDIHTKRAMCPHQNGKDFISTLAYNTGMFGIYGKTINYRGGYEGIGMLTRFPYINIKKVPLPNPQNTEPRVALVVNCEVGADTLCFAATHLDVVAIETRNIQANYLCDLLQQQPYPVVLAGDFNARHYTETIQKIMNKRMAPMTNDDMTFPAWNPFLKLDYIYTWPIDQWHLKHTQPIQSLLSDHLPIVSDIIYVKKH